MGCPETSVRNYYFSLRDNQEEPSSHLLRGGKVTQDTQLLVKSNCRTQLVNPNNDIHKAK